MTEKTLIKATDLYNKLREIETQIDRVKRSLQVPHDEITTIEINVLGKYPNTLRVYNKDVLNEILRLLQVKYEGELSTIADQFKAL